MELFKSFSDVTFTHVEHTNADALFTLAAAKDYDVLVLYDMWQKIDQAAQTNFVNLVTSDKGVVALRSPLGRNTSVPTRVLTPMGDGLTFSLGLRNMPGLTGAVC